MKWKANYKDDTSLMQFEGDKENSYKDIDRSKLSSFAILGDSGELILLVQIERPTQKLIYRQRVVCDLGGEKDRIWLVGWHENINGKSIKSIAIFIPMVILKWLERKMMQNFNPEALDDLGQLEPRIERADREAREQHRGDTHADTRTPTDTCLHPQGLFGHFDHFRVVLELFDDGILIDHDNLPPLGKFFIAWVVDFHPFTLEEFLGCRLLPPGDLRCLGTNSFHVSRRIFCKSGGRLFHNFSLTSGI